MKYLLLTLTLLLTACNQTTTPPPETTDEIIPEMPHDRGSEYDLDLDSALQELEMVDAQ